jgi:hypothetical protein
VSPRAREERRSGPTFAYEFNDGNAPENFLPPVSFPYGAAHASEIQYLFAVPVAAHGAKLRGKFGRIDGQVTWNGWPLYLFTGEKPHQNHADSSFKVVSVKPWP